eukprot:GEMP01026058.1.p1 GENE.GEMP01026058.1~~GEMP01026058.1.p1  ORF type:complete len:384 (+),score=62.53 GEMP01026058.1:86-1237(+)
MADRRKSEVCSAQEPPRISRKKYVVLAVVVMCIGALATVQNAMLGVLEETFNGDPLLPAVINMIGALFLSSILSLPPPIVKIYSTRNTHRKPYKWWMPSSGLLHVLFITTVAIGASKNDVMQHIVAKNLGQVLGAAIIDQFGPLEMPKRRLTVIKAVSIVCVCVGVITSCLPSGDKRESVVTPYIAVSLLSGIIVTLQGVINVAGATALPYKPQCVVITYAVALPISLISWGVFYAVRGGPALTAPAWYLCSVGAIGMLIVFAQANVAPMIGMSAFYIFVVTAQVVNSIIVSSTGMFGGAPEPFTWPRGVGAVLVILGTAITLFDPLSTEKKDVRKKSAVAGLDDGAPVQPAPDLVSPKACAVNLDLEECRSERSTQGSTPRA